MAPQHSAPVWATTISPFYCHLLLSSSQLLPDRPLPFSKRTPPHCPQGPSHLPRPQLSRDLLCECFSLCQLPAPQTPSATLIGSWGHHSAILCPGACSPGSPPGVGRCSAAGAVAAGGMEPGASWALVPLDAGADRGGTEWPSSPDPKETRRAVCSGTGPALAAGVHTVS